jgi:hypothetical protein
VFSPIPPRSIATLLARAKVHRAQAQLAQRQSTSKYLPLILFLHVGPYSPGSFLKTAP